MPLFSRRSEAEEDAQAPLGAEHLSERESLKRGGLLASWYIHYRLEEEVERAVRYGRPLTIMIASPELLPGERLTREAWLAAADAALFAARGSDLVGWADDDGRILIIMPETDPAMGEVAARRWRDEIWRRGRAVSGPKWDITLIDDPQQMGPERKAA